MNDKPTHSTTDFTTDFTTDNVTDLHSHDAAPATTRSVAVLGLGNMGGAMAAHLIDSGFTTTLFDLDTERVDALVVLGGHAAASAAEAAAGADYVITMLPTPWITSEVMLDGGVAAAMKPGSMWIDTSTSIRSALLEVEAELDSRGVRYAEAPVTGMSHGARNGTLEFFVGASPEDFEEALPLLQVMGNPERIFHVGPRGSGYVVKLIINQLWFNHTVALGEMMALGVKSGVDAGVLHSAIAGSPATSFFHEHGLTRILFDADYDDTFAMALACKDSRLTVALADELQCHSALTRVVDAYFEESRITHGDRAGEMSPFKLFEEAIGTPIRSTRSGATVVA